MLQRFNLLVFKVIYRLVSPVVAEALRLQLPELEHAQRELEESQRTLQAAVAALEQSVAAHLPQIEHLRTFERSEGRLQASVASLEVVVENLRDDVAALQEKAGAADGSPSKAGDARAAGSVDRAGR